MADVKISALPASSTPLAGTEVLPIVQSATTRQVSVANLTAGRSVGGANFIPSSSSIPTNGMYLPAANTLGFSTNSTVQMSITSVGDVGIGTASPGTYGKFTVLGSTAGNATAAPTLLAVINNGSNYTAKIVLSDGNTNSGFVTYTGGASAAAQILGLGVGTPNQVNINASGNVGIGVSSPISVLDIYAAPGSAYIQMQRSDQAGFGARFGVADTIISGTPTRSCGVDGFSAVCFGIAGTEKMRITSAGVFDIGTGAGAVGQIQFPATAVPSANANTLDDYEEGTWTGTYLSNANMTGTPTFASGRYTKAGNLVNISAIISGTVTLPNLLTYVGFSGIPFAPGVNTVGTGFSNQNQRVGTTNILTNSELYVYFPAASQIVAGADQFYINVTYTV